MRRKAEEIVRRKAAQALENLEILTPEESSMLHELQVHQVQIEMQNEEISRAQAELDAIRTRYFDLYERAPVGYCTLNEEGVILETNLTAATLLCVERDALVQKPITRFILPDYQESYFFHHKQIFETGEPQTCELRMERNDGTVFWAQVEATAAQYTDGAPVCRAVLSEITERKLQEGAIELTERLILLVNTQDDFRACLSDLTASLQAWSGCEAVGIRLRDGDDFPYYETRGFPSAFLKAENHLCAYDADGKIARNGTGNPVLDCMCGNILCGWFDPGKSFFTAYGSFWTNCTTDLLTSTSEADRQARTRNRCNGEGYESVALIPLRHNSQVFGLLQFNDRRPNRFTPGLMLHFERVAESLAIVLSRRQAEEALWMSEERLDLAQSVARTGVWDWNVTTGHIEWSKHLFNLFGLDPLKTPASFEAWRSILHSEDRETASLRIEQALKEQTPLESDYRVVLPDGQIRWINSVGQGRYDDQGRPIRMIGICTDITDRKRIEGVQVFLAQTSSGTVSEPFFETLARYLAQNLGMDYVCIDRLEGDGLTARTVAVWCDGHFEDNVTYALKDTPCGDVVGQTICCFPASVCQFFPRDRALQELRAESYIGVTLWSHTGQPIGLIAVIGRHPLANRRLGEDILKLVAVRAAGELERLEAEEALQKSEKRFRSYFELPLVGISITSPEKGWLEVNDRLCEILGYSREELMRMTWSQLTHPEDLPTDLESFNRVQSGQIDGYSMEKRFIRKDGRTIHADLSVRGLRKADGEIDYFVALIQDITDRKRAEEALRESEERYQRITEAITDYIYTVRVSDGHAVETTHGPGCHAVTGYQAEEFAADSFLWLGMVAMEDRPTVEEQARRILANENPTPIEHRILHKDGTVRWVRNTFVPHRDESGALVSYDGLIVDITERKRTEEALRESEEHLRDAQRLALLGSWEQDVETWHLTWSDQVFRIFELDPEEVEVSVESFVERVHPLDRKSVRAAFDDSVASGQPYDIEHRLLMPDGRVKYVHEHSEVVYDDQGRALQARGTVQDVTDRKRSEEEKARLENQLQQAQKMESVGRLAGGVAHDFNNMLGVILGRVEMAMDQVNPTQSLFTDLEEIHKAASRSADLTRQLLAFARKQAIVPKVLDLNNAIESMLKMLHRLIGEDIDLVWLPGQNLWPVKMDPSQIDQILANLCVNARDAIAGVGKVSIETGNSAFDEDFCSDHADFECGEYAWFTVSDTGQGMDREVLAHIFEPFFTTKATGEGTGLGLATVYGAVKQNSGFVNVYSEPGQGTTFKIYLPRYVGKVEQPQTEARPEPLMARGQETILLVEDEAATLRMFTKLLVYHGYTVLSAGTPGEAIRLAREHAGKIQLLMTDIIMPEMNGLELSNELKSFYPTLKCLYMSGYTANIIDKYGVLKEGVHFIHKPFSIKDILAKVREVLEE